MTKLNHTILAGALAGVAAMPSIASADREIGMAAGFDVIRASTTYDLAETRTDEDGIARLRYNDADQAGKEMGTVVFSPDGRRALYVVMNSGLVNEGTAMQQEAPIRMQCSVSALELSVDATGAFQLQRPASAPYDRFITNNDGNEYRNCNKPQLYVINGGANVAVEYNYQPDNHTYRYMQIMDWDGNSIPINGADKAIVMRKEGDNCSMHQSGNAPGDVFYSAAGRTRIVYWDGCNGGNSDDGWGRVSEVTCDGTPATSCNVTKVFDISLAQEEERSRGRCSVGGPDRSFALCSWTEGNNQPQREGVWIAAIDISDSAQTGEDAQGNLLWKERLERESTYTVNGEVRDAYAMRMNQSRVLQMQPDGSVLPSDDVLLTWGRNRGGNNNDKKGGRTVGVIAAVIKATRADYTYVMPKTNISPLLLGLEYTHVSVTDAVYGKGSTVMPGFTFVMGDHTGGLARNAEMRTLMYDTARNEMVNVGQHDLGRSYDRHLYSNYLGNNPGNQGRNFAGCTLVKNPFADMAGNYTSYFQACAMTGKASDHASSAIKLSAFLTLFPIAFTEDPPPVGGGWDEGELPGDDGGGGGDDDGGPGSSVGGCSTSGGSGTVLLGLALLGLVIRRRK